MRVVFCWMSISGYMASCWRTLAAHRDIDLHIVASEGFSNTPFKDELVKDLPCTLLRANRNDHFDSILQAVTQPAADVAVLSGWAQRHYLKLAFNPSLAQTRLVLAMDTPWTGEWRQHVACYRLRRYLRQFDLAIVSGERSWQYALRLGVPGGRIRKGLYGVDGSLCKIAYERRKDSQKRWPKSFLFVGRMEPEKGIETLVEGYQRYRSETKDPWPLIVCGSGSLEHMIANIPGVDFRGFLQPEQMPDVWASSGVFVIASKFDPWPLVLVEACLSGLPIIHSDACGSAVELVRPLYNGLTTATGDAKALARGLKWSHRNWEHLPLMGERSRQFAEPYQSEHWAICWRQWLTEAVEAPLRRTSKSSVSQRS